MALLLGSLLLALPVGAQVEKGGSAARTQWWNDPVIVQEISLTGEQRSQMDAAFERYSSKLDAVRQNRGLQNEFLEALEKGDWARGRKLLDELSARSTNPHLEMSKLKLEILPILSDAQREKLLAGYPRVIKRQWRPAVGWSRKSGDAHQKGFRGGPGKGGPGPGGPGRGGPGGPPGAN